MTKASPTVLVVCDHISNYTGTAAHLVRDGYIRGLVRIANAIPLLLPIIGSSFDPYELLDSVDGLMLTGSDSNVDPCHYGADLEFEEKHLDALRDATSFPLLKAAIEKDVPAFVICRGLQELNVVCGGSLHQFIHAQPGNKDHRSNCDLTTIENYHNHAHMVTLQSGGLFSSWGLPDEFPVNSLHAQGINRLGDGLKVEALSDDGVIEAISMPDKKFIVGTQWHAEGDCFINKPNETIFTKFGEALRE